VDDLFLVVTQAGDLVGPVLDKAVDSGGWAALLLTVIILGIFWLAQRVIDRQAKSNDQRIETEKQEFAVQLERERQNASNYQSTTNRMVEAFDKNSAAMSEFSSLVRPMSETLSKIDRHLASEDYTPRNKRTP
jgi:uncharacterized membrane-anchored protein YhcB (DUF1043 family)